MNIHRVYTHFHFSFREKRHKLFLRLLSPSTGDRILDVGGYPRYWSDLHCDASITCLNVDRPEDAGPSSGRVTYLQGDGRSLPFVDGSFDIAFSNSAIEHVGTLDDQRAFADEIRRVGRSYWVQTPNRWFLVEPHLLTPFIHYLPRRLQERLVRRFTTWGVITKPSPSRVKEFLAGTRLLTRRDLRELFPDGVVHRERALGLTKSFVVDHPRQSS